MKAASVKIRVQKKFRENVEELVNTRKNLQTRFDEIFCKPLAPKFQTKLQQLTENFEMTTILNNGRHFIA